MTSALTIVWFRQDLRLADNGALSAAVSAGAPVLPVFILDDAAAGAWRMGAASRWWLHHSLASLSRALSERGARLLLLRGDSVDELARLARSSGATALHFTRCYEPAAIALEQRVKARMEAEGVAVKRFGGNLLAEPDAVRTKTGTPFRVYTPFWKALSSDLTVARALPAPTKLATAAKFPRGLTLKDLDLLPTKPDWAGGMRAAWGIDASGPGEAGAQLRLSAFIDGPLHGYGANRNRPDMVGTSRLSPHLHFGEIAPAACWRAATLARDAGGAPAGDVETFLKELVWREFSYHLLLHWPNLPEEPFRPEFAAYPWANDTAARAVMLRAWQRGRTGYPVVDAGMRELWATGWMHNRVRMIVASFLIKHLRIHWTEGEAWFWDTLVDADLASNAASWQWVAGSGADAAPYFRIFNPVTQGEKFDPDGEYVRRWVPELARLPTSALHAPWLADASVLAAAGVTLGKTYPLPMVDHASARAAALAGYAQLQAAR